MKVLWVGNFRESYCSEVHFAREMESLGHEVCRFQEPVGGGIHSTLIEIEHCAEGCDLVMFTRTWGLPPEATAMWRRLESRGTKTASYHLDLYVPLARGANIETDPFWTTQYVFTPDGNPESADYFAARDINHIWSPPAVVSDECATVMPGRFRPEYAYDVVFVGSRGYHSEWPWRKELLDWLETTYRERFHRFGGDVPPGPTRGQDLNDLYASARVVVGDSCMARPDTRYFSDRPFEGYGRGAYMLFPQIDLLEEMIGAYPSYTAGDLIGLRAGIQDALEADSLDRDDTRERLSLHIAEHHTYRDRFAAALFAMGF